MGSLLAVHYPTQTPPPKHQRCNIAPRYNYINYIDLTVDSTPLDGYRIYECRNINLPA